MNGIVSIRSFRDLPSILWGALAPHSHLLQFYDDDVELLESLEAFVAEGLQAGDGVIVIATRAHGDGLRDRLMRGGVPLDKAIQDGSYLALDADETLSWFMVDGWPDSQRFRQLMRRLVGHARGDGRRVRAFGEMVVTLWTQGNVAAAMRLEQLWGEFCHEEDFALLCAYPLSGLVRGKGAMNQIIAEHSGLVAV